MVAGGSGRRSWTSPLRAPFRLPPTEQQQRTNPDNVCAFRRLSLTGLLCAGRIATSTGSALSALASSSGTRGALGLSSVGAASVGQGAAALGASVASSAAGASPPPHAHRSLLAVALALMFCHHPAVFSTSPWTSLTASVYVCTGSIFAGVGASVDEETHAMMMQHQHLLAQKQEGAAFLRHTSFGHVSARFARAFSTSHVYVSPHHSIAHRSL